MAYLPDLHYCQVCGFYLGPDNGDGICGACDLYEEYGPEDEPCGLDEEP